jgi:hypothetical protein
VDATLKAVALPAVDERVAPYYQELRARILVRFSDTDDTVALVVVSTANTLWSWLIQPPFDADLLRLDPDFESAKRRSRFPQTLPGIPR